MSICPVDEYAIDIIQSLIKREGRRIKFCFKSPQQEVRPVLISWVCKVAEELKLRNCTFHLAVYVLDIFMDNHEIATPQLKLLAIVCLLLAAKFEELDSNVPKISSLQSKLESNYEATDFITIEIVILNFLDWNLAYPTVAHFIECFGNFVVQTSDLKYFQGNFRGSACNQDSICKLKQLKSDADDIIQDFMGIVIQDIGYMSFQPSLIAAAVIFLTRFMLSLQPEWTSTLAEVTKWSIPDILPCSAWLKQILHTPDNDSCVQASTGHKKEIKGNQGKNNSSIDLGYSTNSTASSPDIFIEVIPSKDQESYLGSTKTALRKMLEDKNDLFMLKILLLLMLEH
ncbi:hypothetical protein J437_LFUL003159, partial [Ladona fulva]